MKKTIVKGFLGAVIILAVLWVGCESADGSMSWGSVLGKAAALGVICICGILLDRIINSGKKCGR